MVNNDDIINFIAQTIEIGGAFIVTTDDDKFITRNDGEVITLKPVDGEEPRKLAIYGTKNPDVFIVNPFNEGEATQAISNWYYSSRNTLISVILIKTIIRILEAGLRSHGKNAKEEKGDPQCAKYLGKYTSKVDEKMLKEFTSLSSHIHEFANIFYNQSKRIGRFNCLLFKSSAKELYTNVRKASWEVFEEIAKKVLDCKSLDDFEFKPDNPNIPVFESFINIFCLLMEKLEEPAKLAGFDLSNHKVIKSYIPYLDQYHQQAKWCTDSINHLQIGTVDTVTGVNNNVAATGVTAGMHAADLPPIVAGNLNRTMMNSVPMPVMQPVAPMPAYTPSMSMTTGSDLPPCVQQSLHGGYAQPVQMQQVYTNNGSDLPPAVRMKFGY